MTRIFRECVDQKDIVWHSHRSCMPKTLQWSKAMLFGGNTWWSERVRGCISPCLVLKQVLKQKRVKLLGPIIRRPRSHPQHRHSWTHETMKTAWNINPHNPSFDLETREMRLALQNMAQNRQYPFHLFFHLFFAAAAPTVHICLCMMVTAPIVASTALSLVPKAPTSSVLCFALWVTNFQQLFRHGTLRKGTVGQWESCKKWAFCPLLSAVGLLLECMQSKIQGSTDFALCQENQSPGPVPRTSRQEQSPGPVARCAPRVISCQKQIFFEHKASQSHNVMPLLPGKLTKTPWTREGVQNRVGRRGSSWYRFLFRAVLAGDVPTPLSKNLSMTSTAWELYECEQKVWMK